MKNIQEIKKDFDNSRLSDKTTPSFWKKVRNIAATIASIGGLVIAAPISLPTGIAVWIGYAVLVSGTIAGTSHLTKK